MNRNYSLTARIVVASLFLLISAVSLAQAQQGRRMWRFLSDNYSVGVALLEIDKVQAELHLTSDQLKTATEIREKLSADRRALYEGLTPDQWRERGDELRKKTAELAEAAALKIAESLDDGQKQRWLEVTLQLRGAEALPGVQLAERLQLGDEQVKKLNDLNTSQREKMFEIFRQASDEGLSREEGFERYTKLVADMNQQRMALLNEEQTAAFKSLQGASFELPAE